MIYELLSHFQHVLDKCTKQAEAEVVSSSSLVKVEVGGEVGFLQCNLDLSLVVVFTFTGGQLGWLVGGRKMRG